jgi:tetratricopeptide (TPR) repeat protein
MFRRAGLAAALLWAPLPLLADIVSLTDGSVIECKIVEQTVKNNRQVIVVELETKSRRDIDASQVAWISRGKPSWEERAEALEWYAKAKDRAKETWLSQFTLARDCKRKKLEDEAAVHFNKAAELRRADAKETIAEREKIARWLEKDCGLFDAAQEEYLWVLGEKRKAVAQEDAQARFSLGQWCEKNSLYGEALTEYEAALQIKPEHASAAKGVERIQKLRDTLVNPAFFRGVKEQLADAATFLTKGQNKDGSFGMDVSEAGVQALRAQTAMSAMSAIAQWEFTAVDRPDISKTAPPEAVKALEWALAAESSPKKLRGPDCWGSIYVLEFLLMCLDKPAFKAFEAKIKAKTQETIASIAAMQAQDGGLVYYEKNMDKSNSFVDAPAIIVLLQAKRAGFDVPKDLLQRMVQHLKSCKQGDGIFMYKTGVRQTVEGSTARAPAAELALLMAGEGSPTAVQVTVDNFFKNRGILEKIKGQPGTHMGTGGTAPYYFLYGHFYATRAIKVLDKGVRTGYLAKMRDLMIGAQDNDGSFSDWPRTKGHKVYGAAFGALTYYHIATVRSDLEKRDK